MSKRPLPHEGEEARLPHPHPLHHLQPQQQSSLWPPSAHQPQHEHHPAISDQQAAAALLAGPHDPGFPAAQSPFWSLPSPGIGTMPLGPFAVPPELASLHYNPAGEQPPQRHFPIPAGGLLEDSALSGWAGFAAAPQQLRHDAGHYRGNAAAAAPPSPSISWIPHLPPLASMPLHPGAEAAARPVTTGGDRSDRSVPAAAANIDIKQAFVPERPPPRLSLVPAAMAWGSVALPLPHSCPVSSITIIECRLDPPEAEHRQAQAAPGAGTYRCAGEAGGRGRGVGRDRGRTPAGTSETWSRQYRCPG